MRRVLFTAALALFACLPALQAGQPPTPTAGSESATGGQEGDARGTIVVWDNYHSGKPTGHLRGVLRDEDGRVFGLVVARMEDYGGVTGYALTNYGYYDLEGCWDFDRRHECGWFRIEFDYGDTREVELEGDFRGRRSYWDGEWELGPR